VSGLDEAAIAFGTIGGAFTATFLAVLVAGWKLWRGIRAVLKGNEGMQAILGEATGVKVDVGSGSPTTATRQYTGSFQTIIREELAPISARLDGLEAHVDRRLDGIESTTLEHADLLADLSRGHNAVAQRTAEHSAKLNIAEAEQTMTRGKAVR
jgi:hypothetical protein